ncbi:DUF72 domain-containing protein [Candidatus Bipolaricaulota bacterium]|nr:DUF72 domain-containing protein [Candidatus Bipolaricaulota bacterium]
MQAEMHVGTSGYSFRDWVGTVYPSGTPTGKYLTHYAQWFDAVEINATYYRIPPPTVFEAILAKVPSEFTFVVKLPREATHQREKLAEITPPFLDAIAPLVEHRQLGGLLAQFPYSFKNTTDAIRHLEAIARMSIRRDLPVNVEFRNASWYQSDTFDTLRNLGLGFVNVDLPPLPGLPPPSNETTSQTAYYRLHGRNTKTWWNRASPGLRYDYLYTVDALEAWAKRAEEQAGNVSKTFVFTNNCHLGQSVVNALQLHQRLGLERPALPPGISPPLIEPSISSQIHAITQRIGTERTRAVDP